VNDPKSYNDAKSRMDAHIWKMEMDVEIMGEHNSMVEERTGEPMGTILIPSSRGLSPSPSSILFYIYIYICSLILGQESN